MGLRDKRINSRTFRRITESVYGAVGYQVRMMVQVWWYIYIRICVYLYRDIFVHVPCIPWQLFFVWCVMSHVKYEKNVNPPRWGYKPCTYHRRQCMYHGTILEFTFRQSRGHRHGRKLVGYSSPWPYNPNERLLLPCYTWKTLTWLCGDLDSLCSPAVCVCIDCCRS